MLGWLFCDGLNAGTKSAAALEDSHKAETESIITEDVLHLQQSVSIGDASRLRLMVEYLVVAG